MPTFGLPRIAMRGGASSGSGSGSAASSSSAATRSSRSPVPSPCEAETARGSPSPRRLSSADSASSPGLSILFATSRTGLSERRSMSAISASPGPRPARASTTSAITSASEIAVFACSCTDRASSSESARSTPPVSIRSNAIPFHSQRRARRSRVTPGSASTTASLPPARRLTSVLFPAFGKPTTATLGRLDGRSAARGARGLTRPGPSPGPGPRPERPPRRWTMPVVSSSTASSAAIRAPCSRSVSRSSRSRISARTSSAGRPLSAARRRARSSGLAVRKTFRGEPGLTTVPMSRPSAT